LVILRQADHLHFVDDVEQQHEIVRNMTFSRELAWLPKEMRPIEQLCSEHTAHSFTCGLTLCHMDATLRHDRQARQFLAGDIEPDLAARGIDAIVYKAY